eukprot:gene1246-1824_t
MGAHQQRAESMRVLMVRSAQIGFLAAVVGYVAYRELQPLMWRHKAGVAEEGKTAIPVQMSSQCEKEPPRVPQAVQLMDIAFPWVHEKAKKGLEEVSDDDGGEAGLFGLTRNHPRPSTRHIPDEEKGDKWIVITSINEPTEQVKAWATLHPEWRLVVVGDRKSPTDFKWPNCTYLSVDDQHQLPYKSLKVLPWNSYARKIVGYLYAIEHGATVVYETDDDNGFKPEIGLSGLSLEIKNGL